MCAFHRWDMFFPLSSLSPIAFLALSFTQVMLNDFGLAVPRGSVNHWAGTIRYAPQELLSLIAAGQQIQSEPWHDLESLVKVYMEAALFSDGEFRKAVPPN